MLIVNTYLGFCLVNLWIRCSFEFCKREESFKRWFYSLFHSLRCFVVLFSYCVLEVYWSKQHSAWRKWPLASLVLIILLSQVLEPFGLALVSSWQWLGLHFESSALRLHVVGVGYAAWLIWVTLTWQCCHLEGRKYTYRAWSCPLSLLFLLTSISNKYTKIAKCMWGGQQVCVWKIIRVMSLNYLQINDLFFNLNWKICYDLFIKKFTLRHIFALKIIKSSTGNCKTDNMRILKGYIIKSGKVS